MSSHFTWPKFTPGLEGSKTLFSLKPGVTRDSQVTPGLPHDSKTGHKVLLVKSVKGRHLVSWRQIIQLSDNNVDENFSVVRVEKVSRPLGGVEVRQELDD